MSLEYLGYLRTYPTTVDKELATNLVTKKLTSNYWSPLACLVEEQEEEQMELISESHTNIERAMSAIGTGDWKLT